MDLETAADLLARLRDRQTGEARVYVCGGPAEPACLTHAFAALPHLAADITFIGPWLPGINRTDWTQFHPSSRAETTFLYDTHRAAYENGRLAFYPMHYSATAHWLAKTPLDFAFIPVSPPDANGNVSFSFASDFGPCLSARSDVYKIALIKPEMPTPQDAPSAPLSSFQASIEDPAPLLALDEAPLSDAQIAIAHHIAGELSDGDTIQSGIGNIQHIAMTALGAHKRMRIHTGMVSNALKPALASGAIESARGAVFTGTAIGDTDFYTACASDDRFRFRDVHATHCSLRMAQIPRFTAINGAIEVDLFGQVNSEWVGTRQVSATGGVADFVRGAQLADAGRSFIALPATARNGEVSRIVPALASPTMTLSRADADFVVTEHGVARLRDLSVDARAEALISIAAPAHRQMLADAWAKLRA